MSGRPSRSAGLVLALATAALAQACSAGAQPAADASGTKEAPFVAPAGSNVVTVVAREYGFDMPASIPAGLTTFRLRDEGTQQHHLFLVRVDDGRTPADLVEALKAGGPPPAWMHMVGGPNSPAPGGGEAIATVRLEAGSYVAFCIIPAPDGVPHVMKGMIRSLTVTPSTRSAPEPKSDVAIELTDYAFRLSKPITAGRHTIEVTNTASQSHEMFLMRLPPGKTVDDLVAWAAKPAGPPPVVPAGGVTDVPPGGTVYLHADFQPGEYALVCFSPDAKDGKPHVAHGMKMQFTVQ